MAINYRNTYKFILDKLNTVITNEYGGALPVYLSQDDSMTNRTKFLLIEPLTSTMDTYTVGGELKEYNFNILMFFRQAALDRVVLNNIYNEIARFETLFEENISMGLEDSTNIFNCRIEETELDIGEDEEYYVVGFTFVCQHYRSNSIATDTNYSVSFDGDDYIDNPNTDTYEEASVECWFKCGDVTKFRAIFDGTSSDTISTPVNLYISGTHTGKISVNTGSGGWKRGSANLADGEWHHMIFTFKRNGSAGDYNCFIDGASAGGDFPATNVGNELYLQISEIGRDNSGTASYAYHGNMAGLALWNTVLSEDDAKNLYNNGEPVNLLNHYTVTSLQHWWKMGNGTENGSGTTIYDMKGGSDYNATLSGASIASTGVTV